MKRLSLWGRHHQWAARLLIVLSYVVLTGSGFYFGRLLSRMDVHLSPVLLYSWAGLSGLALICYPSRKEKHCYRNFYRRQKTCDGVLVTTSFLLLLGLVNLGQDVRSPLNFSPAGAAMPAAIHLSPGVVKEPKGKVLTPPKELKKNVRTTLRKMRHYFRQHADAGEVGATIGIVLLTLVALYLVLCLSCYVACSAGVVLGVLALIAGAALVITLASRALRRLRGNPPQKGSGEPRVVST